MPKPHLGLTVGCVYAPTFRIANPVCELLFREEVYLEIEVSHA